MLTPFYAKAAEKILNIDGRPGPVAECASSHYIIHFLALLRETLNNKR